MTSTTTTTSTVSAKSWWGKPDERGAYHREEGGLVWTLAPTGDRGGWRWMLKSPGASLVDVGAYQNTYVGDMEDARRTIARYFERQAERAAEARKAAAEKEAALARIAEVGGIEVMRTMFAQAKAQAEADAQRAAESRRVCEGLRATMLHAGEAEGS